MRYKYFINGLSIIAVFLLDFLIQSIFNLSGSTKIFFVSQLHFMLLVLFAREDSRTEIVFKVLIMAFIMDLFEYQSFPVYYIAYGISIMVIRFWHRHISESYMEFVLLSGIGLFIKEILLFVTLSIQSQINMSLLNYLGSRSLWIILFNLLLFFIPYRIYKVSRKSINNYSSRNYL